MCAPGFTKKGWSCVSNINVQLLMILRGMLPAMTTDHFEGIGDSIASETGKDRSQITINDVREGSILIDATVNADNAAQQAEMMATLQTALASGANFAGFTVESASLISNSDVVSSSDNSEAMKYRDIAIIVGVVIPICLSNFLIYLSHHLHCAYRLVQERNYIQ
jgi:hypothetical protein